MKKKRFYKNLLHTNIKVCLGNLRLYENTTKENLILFTTQHLQNTNNTKKKTIKHFGGKKLFHYPVTITLTLLSFPITCHQLPRRQRSFPIGFRLLRLSVPTALYDPEKKALGFSKRANNLNVN